jgi:hypothetical protein
VGATGQSTGSSAASLQWSNYGDLAAFTNLRLLSVKIAGTGNSVEEKSIIPVEAFYKLQ